MGRGVSAAQILFYGLLVVSVTVTIAGSVGLAFRPACSPVTWAPVAILGGVSAGSVSGVVLAVIG
jgi:hypothetical protein